MYNLKVGFTLDLTQSRHGDLVAFTPCCWRRFPLLVVADVLGNQKPLEPLRTHTQFHSVGAIGWSPDGQRLAFEGYRMIDDELDIAVWIVGLDGTGLTRLTTLPYDPESGIGAENDALAWTEDGILYSDGPDLRSVAVRPGTVSVTTDDTAPASRLRGRAAAESHDPESTLVLRRVRSLRISGDGTVIVMERFSKDGERSFWTAAPDGSNARRILTELGTPRSATYRSVMPNYNGRRFLASRHYVYSNRASQLITWSVGRRPSAARTLKFANYGGAGHSWN
ncbi:hypothetical protein [Nocardioides abyssi]|uniref:Uncharacterized protein n=1 Tax=Nocardioides abyssi TaxID=3058370 RepID=A0ABT8ESJ5_9ACTN|nr:hypothetical protein [Nocardioides abyssi]MDN4161089.1 hypothetical protein [Nocardioides abyssi]